MTVLTFYITYVLHQIPFVSFEHDYKFYIILNGQKCIGINT
jgi:hypothetical protein